MANGTNGRKWDRWWVQTIIYIGTLLLAGGVTWATLRGEVKQNCQKNTEQDVRILSNEKMLHRLDNQAVRQQTQYEEIQRSLKRIETKLERVE